MTYKEIETNAKTDDTHFWKEFLFTINNCQRVVRILRKQSNESKTEMLRESIRNHTDTIRSFMGCIKK